MRVNTVKRIYALLVLLSLLVTGFPSLAYAAEIDAMTAILADEELEGMRISTESFEDDGYIGIPYDITVYFDKENNTAKPGYGGTACVLYTVNSMAKRTGTETDVNIIKSMLDRGFIVAVLDYKNNPEAVSPGLEYSVQMIRTTRLRYGEFFTDNSIFPEGTYHETHAVPAGYNITVSDVYFEIDKHAPDGALETIVERWNIDLRGVKANTMVKWTDKDGNRKATQNGWDGTEPVWYDDAAGTNVDTDGNGEYIKAKHTCARTIEDCVKPDGTPIDLNLYMHIIYPDKPLEEVPVMTKAGYEECLAFSYAHPEEPALLRYAFDGYATAIYDFLYVPMCRDDHFGIITGDSVGGITGQNGTYKLDINKGFHTAAIRYLRYLSATQHEKYMFDNNRFGNYGHSKSGTNTFLGGYQIQPENSVSINDFTNEQEMLDYLDKKIVDLYPNGYFVTFDYDATFDANGMADEYHFYDGKTRYQSGKTEDYVSGACVIDGGERQPWLTYTDKDGVLREVPSGVQWVYSNCGGTFTHSWENHAPVFTAVDYYDAMGSAFKMHNFLVNFFRICDVPSLFFEMPLKHEIVRGYDMNYGVDAYQAMLKSSGFYLNNEPLSVVYTIPVSGAARVKTTDAITIKFYGIVEREEVEKITVTDSNGTDADGKWESGYGKTEWSFIPDKLNGNEKYTVTIPADIKGSNGVEAGKEYSFCVYTEDEGVAEDTNAVNAVVNNTEGLNVALKTPDLENGRNRINLRFEVTNNAANIAEIYKASSENDKQGALIEELPLSGAGIYEADVTDYVAENAQDEEAFFYIKTKKAAEDRIEYKHEFNTMDDLSLTGRTSVVNEVNGEEISAVKLQVTPYYSKYRALYQGDWPYKLRNRKVINGGKPVTKDDYGRFFTFDLRAYDTASRPIQLWFNDCTDPTKMILDYSYSRTAGRTKENEWMNHTVDYRVYEKDYALEEQIKEFAVILYSTGSTEMPIYLDSLTVTEHITDMELSGAELVAYREGTYSYKASENDAAFEVDGAYFESFNSAAAAAKNSGAALKLLKNVTLTAIDETAIDSDLTIDLNGYKIKLSDTSLLSLAAETPEKANVTVKNGSVVISDKSLISVAVSNAYEKEYNINLEKLYITTEDGVMVTDVISDANTTPNELITQNITLNDCEVDIRRDYLPQTPVNIFSSGNDKLSVKYTFIGGSVFVSSFIKTEFTDDRFAINFKKDAANEYTKLYTSESAVVDKTNFYPCDGEFLSYNLTETKDGISTYTLGEVKSSYPTAYGAIPLEYDPETYPFAVFKDGEFMGAYSAWCQNNTESALSVARNELIGYRGDGVEVVILMRRDYTIGDADENYENLAHFGGKLIIDLDKYTFTTSTSKPFLRARAQTTGLGGSFYVCDSDIEVKGGAIAAKEAPAVIGFTQVYENYQGNYTATKKYNINFKEVRLIVPEGYNTSIIEIQDKAICDNELGAEFNIGFTDCEFDIETQQDVILFKGADSTLRNILKLRLEGSTINASAADGIKVFSLDEKDSISLKKSGGSYLKLVLPKDADAPQLAMSIDGVEYVFRRTAVYEDDIEYTLSRVVSQNIYENRMTNGGFETVDKYNFPVDWESDGKNMIPNGDFESGTLDAGKNLDGTRNLQYGKQGGVTEVSVVENTNDPEEFGKYALKMKWGTALQWGGAQVPDDIVGVLPLAYGSKYILRASIKAGGNDQFPGGANRFRMNMITNDLNASGKNYNSELTSNSWTATTQWKEYSGEWTTVTKENAYDASVPLHANRYQVLSNRNAVANAELYVDNYSIEKLSRADANTAYKGNNSLKIVAYDDGVDEKWTSPAAFVEEGEEIAVSVAFKAESMSENAKLSAQFYSGDKLVSLKEAVLEATAYEWCEKQLRATVPEGADSVRVSVSVPSADGTLWIDDVFVGQRPDNAFIEAVDYSVDALEGNGGETVLVNVKVSNYNEAQKVFVATALYDGSNNLIALNAKGEELLANTPRQDAERSITLPDNTDLSGYTLVTMLWDGTDYTTPLCEAVMFGN